MRSLIELGINKGGDTGRKGGEKNAGAAKVVQINGRRNKN